MKRLLAFVLLIGAGFYLLSQLVGEDLIVTASESTEEEGTTAPERGPARPPNRGRSGVGLTRGSFGATAEQRGELHLFRIREILQPDGTVLKQDVFALHAKDSQPLRDGLQQLDSVEVTLFEDGKPGAKIFATRALVQLGTDANGKAALDANKEIAMTDVVFEALAGSRLEGLRIELDFARALIDDDELQIYTPSPDDPVRIVFAGERSATLVGKGLLARLPRSRNGALKRVDITILSDPLLMTPGVVARARGRLHYSEDTASDVAELSMTDGVELDLDRSTRLTTKDFDAERADTGDADKMHIVADQMFCWLARGKVLDVEGQTSEQMIWRMLQLHGAPARIDMPQLRVSTPQLTMLPGPFGMPFWITASGGVSRIEQVPGPNDVDAPPITGSSPRRIHLFRGSELLGATHRSFGFPQWAIAPLEDFHTVAFEGNSHLEDNLRAIDASAGLQVFHTDATQQGVISRGFGNITMVQKKSAKRAALRATSNDGYSLVTTADRELLDLGPKATPDGDDRWRNHRYQLEHGELHATGTGSCRLVRKGDLSTVLLRAPDREIEAVMASRGVNFSDVRYLRAEFVDNDVRTFDLAGLPARVVLEREGETLFATAPRIVQTSPASLRLLTADLLARPQLWDSLRPEDALPHLRREAPANDKRGKQLLDARAPQIDLYYMGGNDVLVDALSDGDVPARANATIERLDGGPPIMVEFEAERLRALPYSIPPAVMRMHLGGSSSPAALLPFFTERGTWILGDGVHKVRVVDSKSSFEGSAHRMLMSTAAEACLLLGDPDTMTPAKAIRTTEGRVVTARGAQVRIFRDDSVRLQTFRAFPGRSIFLLPEVELHQTDRGDVMSHMIATCRGDISVLPEAVLFHGPVVVRSVTADGSTLPDGLGIVAEFLKMELHPETGEVLRVLGHEVDLDWSRVSGHAADIELDVRWNRLTAYDPDDVIVTLANGAVITGQRVTVDYHTLAFDIFRGRVDR